MARYKITNKALVEALNLSHTALFNLKNFGYLPELNSNICNIFQAISNLAGVKITPFDLMEYIDN